MIGQVKGKKNYLAYTNYSFIDQHPLAGLTYMYRLVQYDLDNSRNYSAIQVVKFGASESAKVYPNPVKAGNLISIQWGSAWIKNNYQLADVQGRVIKTGVLSSYRQTVSTAGLTKGFYFLRVNNAKPVVIEIQ